ncbi:PREDICTED: uncharacterized protein LOC102840059 [Chrysochloris asiatica]|uniref:FAS-associated death domain protein n=1 Tax=Chrysochloris asiatica TaxID=185453 RepID=A0A9B0WKM2_CHRAS|nr:PREDICTED: uncharacterized protein LOC102840059 [Chrysochloris asiatica]
MDPFLVLLHSLSSRLSSSELDVLKFLCSERVGKRKLERVQSGLDLFSLLLEQSDLSPEQPELLRELLASLPRHDLLRRLDAFEADSGAGANEGELRAAFDIICDNVGKDWKRLARHLQLSDAKIEAIVERHPRHLTEQVREVLRTWKAARREHATVAQLVVALRACCLNLVADLLEEGQAGHLQNGDLDKLQTSGGLQPSWRDCAHPGEASLPAGETALVSTVATCILDTKMSSASEPQLDLQAVLCPEGGGQVPSKSPQVTDSHCGAGTAGFSTCDFRQLQFEGDEPHSGPGLEAELDQSPCFFHLASPKLQPLSLNSPPSTQPQTGASHLWSPQAWSRGGSQKQIPDNGACPIQNLPASQSSAPFSFRSAAPQPPEFGKGADEEQGKWVPSGVSAAPAPSSQLLLPQPLASCLPSPTSSDSLQDLSLALPSPQHHPSSTRVPTPEASHVAGSPSMGFREQGVKAKSAGKETRWCDR